MIISTPILTANDIGILMMTEAGYDLEAVDTVSAKLKQSTEVDPTVCRYDAENQDVSLTILLWLWPMSDDCVT